MKVRCLAAALLATAAAACSEAPRDPTPEELASAERVIDPELLRLDVGVLAHDSMMGRQTPSPGLQKSVDYVRRQVERMGLAPGVDGGYVQPWSMRIHEREGAVSARATAGDAGLELTEANSTQLLLGVSAADLPVAAPIVFAGFGIDAPEHDWDDYDAIDVEDKVVLLMDGAPWEVDTSVPFGYDNALTKAAMAYARGARAVLYATESYGKPDQPPATLFLEPFADGPITLLESEAQGNSLLPPTFLVSFESAERLLDGRRIEDLRRESREAMAPVAFEIPESSFEVTLESPAEVATPRNVIAVLPGSDPLLGDEYVVFSAHIDHVGVEAPVDGDSIYNGADDDASGSAGLLALARALLALPPAARPRRSIAFMWFSGEERGRYGSSAYGDAPTIPFGQVAANLNLDMIGRASDNTVFVDDFVGGPLQSTALALASEVDVTVSPTRFDAFRLLYFSDHFNFFSRQVPAVFFFTGLHEDYHGPGDHADRIDYASMQEILRLALRTGLEVANRDERPAWGAPPYYTPR